MPEYIEREAALSKPEILTVHTKEFGKIDVVPVEYIADLPTADVEPVVHGKWIEHMDSYENYCECSICHYIPDAPLDETPRCPNCGAKMQEAR